MRPLTLVGLGWSTFDVMSIYVYVGIIYFGIYAVHTVTTKLKKVHLTTAISDGQMAQRAFGLTSEVTSCPETYPLYTAGMDKSAPASSREALPQLETEL